MSEDVKNHKIIIFAIFEKFLKVEKKYFWKIIFIKVLKWIVHKPSISLSEDGNISVIFEYSMELSCCPSEISFC